MTTNNNAILDFLLAQGDLTQEQYEQVTAYAEANGVATYTALIESKIGGDSKQVIKTLANRLNLDFVDVLDIQSEIDPNIAKLFTVAQAQNFPALPLYVLNGSLNVAVPIESAKSVQVKDDIRRLTKHPNISLVVSTRKDIKAAINRIFRADDELDKLKVQQQRTQAAAAVTTATEAIPEEIVEESEVVRFVDLVLSQGIRDKASDIHFEPREHSLQIRYRIDGILYDMVDAPKAMMSEITSRIKIMASLDISITRIPQDGRLTLVDGGRKIDFRLATLPTVWGEKIVLRILDNSAAQLALSELGFSETNLQRFRESAFKPYGMVLVTGPTGSGKSTTLYSALNEISSSEINIITAEDPVEYQLEGINQVAVNPKQKLTFETVLRTVLRADPDVILVGEIRDLETARIAMQAGLTGHMVFSTLHTNDAASAVTRLGDMGVEPFITASTLTGVVSQRLIRRLDPKTKVPYTPTTAELDAIGFDYSNGIPTLFKPGPSPENNNTGYKGRLAIHEVLTLSENLQEAIINGTKAIELNRMALREGMISLKQDGFEKARQGLTSIEEVLRVVI